MTRARPADLLVVVLGGSILATALALALLGSRGLDPIANLDLCWSRILLDRDCPGCGLTRSFVALAGGHLGRALQCNPVGPLLFAALTLLTILHALRLGGARLPRLGRIDVAVGIAVVGALVFRGFHFYLG
ncbi:MAG TPA: DUF2752 domain-containing protein [Thermoanaerobaculia bacterium]|nr:DUF2752 domain-containing protein [Thermoanaerobaculia bacterium]